MNPCQCGCGKLVRKRFARGHNHRGSHNSGNYEVREAGFPTPCWLWRGVINHGGYGLLHVNGKARRVHRFLYEEAVGPIQIGLVLDHLCRNRSCVNPAHLEPVTRAVNNYRGQKTKLSSDDVLAIRQDLRPLAAIAAQYGVHPVIACGVRSGRLRNDSANTEKGRS